MTTIRHWTGHTLKLHDTLSKTFKETLHETCVVPQTKLYDCVMNGFQQFYDRKAVYFWPNHFALASRAGWETKVV